jgi:predicted transposase YbfD/YdcC
MKLRRYPALLDLLEVKGCIITIDAMGCQTDTRKKSLKNKPVMSSR